MSIATDFHRPIDSGPMRELGRRVAGFMTARVFSTLAVAAFALFVLLSSLFGLIKPEHNWDMAPYIAASLEDRYEGLQALHTAAWEATRYGISDFQWYEITRGNTYIVDQFANPDHFVSQLSMYRVKLGYILALRYLDRLVEPVTATAIVASLSTLVVGLVLLAWAVRHGFSQSLLLAAPVLLLAGYFDMAMLATPDMMMAAFGIPGIYLAAKGRYWLSVPFLLAMFLVRPDGIIFLFALLLAALAFGQGRLPMLLAFLAAVLMYGPIAEAAGHPGWWPHYYFSNIALQNDMRGFEPAFSIGAYLHGIVRGINVGLRFNNWPMIMAVLLLGWLLLAARGRGADRNATMVLTAIVLCFIGKYVTFPLPDDRVYFIFVAPFLMILLEAWKPDFATATAAFTPSARRPN
ncbi:MAG: hypothetical protein V7704_14285 [Aurantimonas endophytica]|uniref:hypothetical protein n=1 Tax=Aurantimonas endophytica TaxID=1522175 RepID=UPI0030033848